MFGSSSSRDIVTYYLSQQLLNEYVYSSPSWFYRETHRPWCVLHKYLSAREMDSRRQGLFDDIKIATCVVRLLPIQSNRPKRSSRASASGKRWGPHISVNHRMSITAADRSVRLQSIDKSTGGPENVSVSDKQYIGVFVMFGKRQGQSNIKK